MTANGLSQEPELWPISEVRPVDGIAQSLRQGGPMRTPVFETYVPETRYFEQFGWHGHVQIRCVCQRQRPPLSEREDHPARVFGRTVKSVVSIACGSLEWPPNWRATLLEDVQLQVCSER